MKKVITALMLALTLTVVGCQSDDSISTEEKIEKSNEIMQQEEIEATEEDQETIEELAEEEEVLYSYIKSDDKRVDLNIKFTEDVEDEEKERLVGEYTSRLEEKYEGKDVRVNIIPADQEIIEREPVKITMLGEPADIYGVYIYTIELEDANYEDIEEITIDGEAVYFEKVEDVEGNQVDIQDVVRVEDPTILVKINGEEIEVGVK